MTQMPEPPAPEPIAPRPVTTRGRKGLVWALWLVVVAALAFGGLSAYLWNVHSQYVAQNDELRSTATGLGGSLAESRALADAVGKQLDETNAQLDEAKDTIKDLANSEAQAGDDRQSLVDIATSLKECADARQDLIDHLKEASRWTPASLRASEESITTYCDKVAKSLDAIVDE